MSIFFHAQRKPAEPLPRNCSVCNRVIPFGVPYWKVFGLPYCLRCHEAMDQRAAHEDDDTGDRSVLRTAEGNS